MSKKKAAEEAKKAALPTSTFEAGKIGIFRFKHNRFRVPGFNEGAVITAEEALKDQELLAHLVEVKAAVIEKVGEVAEEEEEG
ncbi:hypothetical protein D770_20270 [Flammeovirgaceae bacterium 311]|nr:hypothetical protein D770_20270 [Flammeovirgaceae bacterium 311]